MISVWRRLHSTWQSRGSFHTKNSWNPPSKYGILVQFETRPRKKIAILPNKVACNRPLQRTACWLHRESDMHEDEGWDIPEGTLDSRSATGCTQIEFANRSTRSTWTGCKNIFWPTKRIKEFLEDREQQPCITEFLVYLFLQFNSKRQIAKTRLKSWLRSSRTTRNKESFLQDCKQTKEINMFNEESQELTDDMNNTEIFELC